MTLYPPLFHYVSASHINNPEATSRALAAEGEAEKAKQEQKAMAQKLNEAGKKIARLERELAFAKR